MEQNDKWVEDRLNKLNPESEWQAHVPAALARFEGRRAERRFMGRWPRAISVVVVAGICVLTFPQPRALAQRVLAPCVEACESLAMSPGDFHDHLHGWMWAVHSFLGIAPPDFEATDATGASFRLSNSMGKVVLLNFWATWCKPCQEEIPWFVEFQSKYGNDGFEVIGVSLDEVGWKAVRPAMEALKINYRVAIADGALAQKYGGLETLPETLLIDRKGRLLAKHSGITSKDQYEREIVRALWNRLGTAERDRLRTEGLE
jgi:cytochrome c biogenesis protein CcmG/thiol:disulfide interchange protein DsbE